MVNSSGWEDQLSAMIELLAAAGRDNSDNAYLKLKAERLAPRLMPLSDAYDEGNNTYKEHDMAVEKLISTLRQCDKDAPRMPPQEETRSSSPHISARGDVYAVDKVQDEAPPQPQPQPAQPEEDEDYRDSFDRDYGSTCYPKIGPGYSDNISVVSDLTIPTVQTGLVDDDNDDSPYLRSHRHLKLLEIDVPGVINENSSNDSGSRSPKSQTGIRAKINVPAGPVPQSQTAATRKEPDLRAPSGKWNVTGSAPPVTRPGGAAYRRHVRAAAVGTSTNIPPINRRPSNGTPALSQAPAAVSGAVRLSDLKTSSSESPNFFPPTAQETEASSDTGGLLKKPKSLSPRSKPGVKPSFFDAGRAVGRRSLLRKSNKYAASVNGPTPSSRGLLAESTRNVPPAGSGGTTTRRSSNGAQRNTTSGQRNIGSRSEGGAKRTSAGTGRGPRSNEGGGGTSSNGPLNGSSSKGGQPSNVDLDGVLSTMGQDIDFIFRELSALEEGDETSLPKKGDQDDEMSVVSESNIGATAKLKYTLGSVARTLRKEGKPPPPLKKQDEPKAPEAPASSGNPLLIDEDGFIISSATEQTSVFDNAFAPPPEAATLGSNNKDGDWWKSQGSAAGKSNSARSKKHESEERLKAQMTNVMSRYGDRPRPSSRASTDAKQRPLEKERRIDAVEAATKHRIEMLRKLVAERALSLSEEANRGDGSSRATLNTKLDFVEAETMRQISRLRDRLGSQRDVLA